MGIGTFYNDNLKPVRSDGVVAAAAADGFTLIAGQTYYLSLPDAVSLLGLHVQGLTAALVLTSVEVEAGVIPRPLLSAVVGDWTKVETGFGSSSAIGTGWTNPSLTAAAAGTGVGAATWNLRAFGMAQLRLKIVVGATGGDVRIGVFGKPKD